MIKCEKTFSQIFVSQPVEKMSIILEHIIKKGLSALQLNLDYLDLDYPDFSIIRTFSLVLFFFMNINKL